MRKINFHLHESGLQTWEDENGTPIMYCDRCSCESEWPWGDSDLEAVCPVCGYAVDYDKEGGAE